MHNIYFFWILYIIFISNCSVHLYYKENLYMKYDVYSLLLIINYFTFPFIANTLFENQCFNKKD